MAEHLFQLAALLLANLGCAVLGGVVGSALTGRDLRHRAPEPVAPASDPEDPEDECEAPTIRPATSTPNGGMTHRPGWSPRWRTPASDRHVAGAQDPAAGPLDGETVRIRVAGARVEGARHRGPVRVADPQRESGRGRTGQADTHPGAGRGVRMRTLADLEALADHIGKLETAGDHSAATVYWDLFNDAVAEMTEDQLRAAVKQLLIARSDSSVRLASAPRGIFSRLVAS
jgi:hypothetical protein